MRTIHSLLLGATLAASTAHAGLPLFTEDAEVLAPRDCEFEAGALSQREPAATALEQALNLTCGVGFGSQIGLAAGRLNDGGARSQQGALGGKVSLWQGEDGAGAALEHEGFALGSTTLRRWQSSSATTAMRHGGTPGCA